MKHKRSKNLTFLLFVFSLFFILRGNVLIAQNVNILHLEKKDFEAFFDENKEWKENFFKKCECERWHYHFFCWDQESRKILFPDVNLFPCIDRRLPEALNDKLINHYKGIKSRKTFLISNDQMTVISLKHLSENKYQYIFRVKSLCKDIEEENIEFYIFDFVQDDKMDIYLCLKDSSGELKFFVNELSLNNSTYVGKIKDISRDVFDAKIPDIKIIIRLGILIGECTIADIYPGTKFIHFINNDKKSPERHNKLISTYAGKGYLISDLVFNLSDQKDLLMLKTNGIYVGPINQEKRITYSSLYSLILEYYKNTNLVIKDKTFELFYARTTNFDIDNPLPNEKTEKIELPKILSFIKDIIKERIRTKKKKPYIQLIGFADLKGKESSKWEKRNFELAKTRAGAVKKWLEDNLGSLRTEVEFDEPVGCRERYYTFSDRCVDIRIF